MPEFDTIVTLQRVEKLVRDEVGKERVHVARAVLEGPIFKMRLEREDNKPILNDVPCGVQFRVVFRSMQTTLPGGDTE